MGITARTIDIYYVYKFIRTLTSRWEDLPAFRYGIIDRNGTVKRPMESLRKNEELDSYTYFDRLCWKIKRVLEKTPIIGKLRLTSFAAALWLLKEHLKDKTDVDMLEDKFVDYLRENYAAYPVTKQLIENCSLEKTFLRAGKYKIVDTNIEVTLPEEIWPVGSCLGKKIYRIGKYVMTSEHLEKLTEDGESVTTGPINTSDGVMPYIKTGQIPVMRMKRKKKTFVVPFVRKI